MVNFRWTGYNALILLAAMQAVPRDYYEAARSTAPAASASSSRSPSRCCAPTIIFVVITSTIGGLQIFAEPRLYDQYGLRRRRPPVADDDALPLRARLDAENFGRAAAVAWMLFLIIVVFALVNFLVTRRIASKGQR